MVAVLSLVLSMLVPSNQTAARDNAHLTRLVRRAGSGIRWIADPYCRHDLRRRGGESQPIAPPIDRNRLLDRALARARAERRIVLAYLFRIEGRQMYRAPLVDLYMRLAVWSDPDVVSLVNRRFVPLRLYADKNVAKRLGVFNAEPEDELYLRAVEPAVVFVDPEGKVLHRVDRIRTFSAHWMRHVLQVVLRQHPPYAAPGPAAGLLVDDASPDALLWLAGEQVKDGDERKALATLARASKLRLDALAGLRRQLAAARGKQPAAGTPAARRWSRDLRRLEAGVRELLARTRDSYLLRAKALRLARRAREALAVLDTVLEELGAAAGGEHSFWLERARSHVALGQGREALRSLVGAGPSSEAAWLRGVVEWQQGRIDAAEKHFAQAVSLGEAPFHWRAAAMLARAADTTRFSPLAHGFELFRYGVDRIYATALPATTELGRSPEPAAARAAIARAALDYLLRQQRPDGAWTDGRYVWSGVDILPNVHVAVTALAATALLAWREVDPQRVDRALAKAEKFLRDDRRIAFGKEEEVYSHAYRMLYWVRKAAAQPSALSESRQHLAQLARRAAAIQDQRTGFFAHEYPNAFCTGAMLWSLHLAKTAGVEIDDDMIHLGVKALLAARRQDGSFAYARSAVERDRRRAGGAAATHRKDSAARMPVCEAVLHAFGSSDRDKVEHAFETFLTYLDRIARVRKCDFHSDGELAGFFFWHAMFHATEVKGAIGEALREKFEQRMLDLVTSFPEIDGSFVDSHELGKGYGTAMALLVLDNLEQGR